MHTYQHRGVWQSRSGVNADRVGAGRRLLGLAFRHCIENATDTVPASHRLMYAGARTIVPPKSATRDTQEHRAKSYESTSSDRASVCSSAPVCREPCPLLGEREVQVQFDSRNEVLEVQSGQERRVHGVGRRHSFTEMFMGLSTELSSNTGLHGAAGTALLGLQVVHGKLNAQQLLKAERNEERERNSCAEEQTVLQRSRSWRHRRVSLHCMRPCELALVASRRAR